jgi:hypothetical protein
MPPRSDELLKPWKCAISAEIAGQVEFALTDPITKKPKYGARKQLLEALLGFWLAREAGLPADQYPAIPSLEQLRSL